MYISRLVLDDFRSWKHCVLDLAPGVTILQGANGLGKTNLVEAIEVLSTGSSHRTSSCIPLIRQGCTKATIRANVVFPAQDETTAGQGVEEERHRGARNGPVMEHGDELGSGARSEGGRLDDTARVGATAEHGDGSAVTTTFEATVVARGANRARIDGGHALYLRDIVGKVPSIAFTPEDQRLISGEPAGRRAMLDQAGAMLIPGYMERVQTCARIARQRAALLKRLGERGVPVSSQDGTLESLETWTGQFIQVAVQVTRDRAAVVDYLAEPFTRIHDALGGGRHRASLAYVASLDEALGEDDPTVDIGRHFQRLYAGEVARGQNLIGPHRDDVAMSLQGNPAKDFASNGQMWTMALALRMALYEVVSARRSVNPVVILDDVFAQLDESRRRQILSFAQRQDQVIITVAAASDIPDIQGSTIIDVERLMDEDEDEAMALVRQWREDREEDRQRLGKQENGDHGDVENHMRSHPACLKENFGGNAGKSVHDESLGETGFSLDTHVVADNGDGDGKSSKEGGR